jgi:hypothetical protein
MMATTLEISFLKHDDKKYFIYPLLCYNDILCIFYPFYRINFWNVVLFGSPYVTSTYYGTLKEAGREEDLWLAGEDQSPKKWVELERTTVLGGW